MTRETYIETIDTMETLPPEIGKRRSREKRGPGTLGMEILAVMDSAEAPITAIEIAHRVNERGIVPHIRPEKIQAIRVRLYRWEGERVQKVGNRGLWEIIRGAPGKDPHIDREEIVRLAAALFTGGMTAPEMLGALRMRDPSGVAKVKSLGPFLREFEGVHFVRVGKKETLTHRQKWRAKR